MAYTNALISCIQEKGLQDDCQNYSTHFNCVRSGYDGGHRPIFRTSPYTQADVIVVGMGPAGSSAAYELSQRGLSVLAFDKQAHPRYKVCGAGLSGRIAKIQPADFSRKVLAQLYWKNI